MSGYQVLEHILTQHQRSHQGEQNSQHFLQRVLRNTTRHDGSKLPTHNNTGHRKSRQRRNRRDQQGSGETVSDQSSAYARSNTTRKTENLCQEARADRNFCVKPKAQLEIWVQRMWPLPHPMPLRWWQYRQRSGACTRIRTYIFSGMCFSGMCAERRPALVTFNHDPECPSYSSTRISG